MMGWIVGSSVRLGGVAVAAAVAVLGLGIYQLRSAPVDAYPEFMPPTVQIQTEALGLSAAEVEQLITVPLEQDLLNGVPWLSQISSESMPGLSKVDLVFEPGTDVLQARQLTQERLAQAVALPNVGTRPVMIQPLSSMQRVMVIGLTSKDLSRIDMSLLARWKIRPKLQGIPGVANVAIFGQRDRQLQVQVDPERLEANGISLDQVVTTAGNALWSSPLTFVEASTPGTGGFIDTTNQRLGVQHLFPITTPQQLASVAVEDTDGRRLRLSDVATVVVDHQPLIGDAQTDRGPSVMLVIEKFPGADTRQVTKDIEAAMGALAPGLSGIQIDTHVYRPADYVDASLRNVGLGGLAALVLVLLVIGAFSFSWRMTLVSFVAILISLVSAALVLYYRGATFNAITLAGLVLAIGVVVDDAVVDVDGLRHRLRRRDGSSTPPTVGELVAAWRQQRGPLVYATVILAIMVAPLLIQTGVAGAFSRSLVASYLLAVLTSMAVALTLTPALSFLLLGRVPLDRRSSPLDRLAERAFDRGGLRLLRQPLWAVVGVVALVVVGGLVIPQLGGRSLLPTPQDRDVLVEIETVPGTSLQEMDRVTTAMSREVRALPGIVGVGVHLGRAITSDRAENVNAGEMWVTMDDAAEYAPTLARVRSVIDGYPGVRTGLLTYQKQRLAAADTGHARPLVVRVFGPSAEVLKQKAEEVRSAISTVSGVADARVELTAEEPIIQVQVNLAAAQEVGLKPGDVRRSAATLVSGLLVGNLYENQQVFDVVVLGDPAIRHDVTSVENLLIDTPSGGQVRLGDVATVQVAPYPPVIRHEDVSRYVDVTADVHDRSLSAVKDDVARRVHALSFPLEHHAEVLADPERQDATRLLLLAFAAVLLAFLLLQAATRSWRAAALLLLVLPLAAAGAAPAAWLAGGIVSAGALMGLVLVSVVAIRSLVLLGDGFASGDQTDRLQLVFQGTRQRVRPVLTTHAAVAAGLLPFVILGDRAGLEIIHPLSVVALGGLVTSAIVTLFLFPALYLRLVPGVAANRPLEESADERPDRESEEGHHVAN